MRSKPIRAAGFIAIFLVAMSLLLFYPPGSLIAGAFGMQDPNATLPSKKTTQPGTTKKSPPPPRTVRKNTTRTTRSNGESNTKAAEETRPSMTNPPPAGTIVRNQIGMEFGYVPAGTFMMGSTEAEAQAAYEDARRYNNDAKLEWFAPEMPRHQVEIREGFYMGRYEVTQAQWQAVMGKNPSNSKDCEQCPVERVSWGDVREFIRRMNARGDGFQYRLPGEAEWEYACRAGTATEFSVGNALSPEQANFNGDYPYGGAAKGVNRQKTMPVGSFQPNAWGLYDMHGNVWEWCEDYWHESYDGAPGDNSAWLSGGDSGRRVLRGGSWYDHARLSRSANRAGISPASRLPINGFRLVVLVRS